MAERGPRLPAGYRLVRFDEIDSTHAEAARRAAAGEAGPLWIVAGRQTKGRGRYGRHWVSEPGNLYASLLLRLGVGPLHAANVSLLAGLALFDAAAACLPPEARGALSLKWPNDLMIEGRKTSGLLLEAVGPASEGETVLAVGFGLNIRHAPGHMPYPVTCLAEHGGAVSPAEALEHLAAAFDHWLGTWDLGRGFPAIREAWLARAGSLGGPIAVTTAQERWTGTFEGIDEEGALVLRLADGTIRRVLAGDVFLGSANAGGAG